MKLNKEELEVTRKAWIFYAEYLTNVVSREETSITTKKSAKEELDKVTNLINREK